MTSQPGMLSQGPPACSIETVREAAPGIADNNIFLYGPAAIDRRYQGQGILTRLLTYICSSLQEQFNLAVALVELTDRKSLSIHRHYPMSEAACFRFNRRKYVVFTFSPTQFLRHYGVVS